MLRAILRAPLPAARVQGPLTALCPVLLCHGSAHSTYIPHPPRLARPVTCAAL